MNRRYFFSVLVNSFSIFIKVVYFNSFSAISCPHFRITDIKYNSPAHTSGKIEDGDEIIQINYQTVVGWHYKRVLQQLQESPPDVLLTLKKRPRHTKIYGQIYMKPYRLPSKKRSLPYRFGESLPSPRIEFTPSQNFPVLLPLTEKGNLSDSDSSSTSSILIPAESTTKSNEKDLRLYLPKPRAVLQRRNTICGDRASGFHGNITFWHEMTIRRNNIEGNSLRDKSVSVGFGLEISPAKRPITCIGIHNKEKYGDLGSALKGSLPDMKIAKDDVRPSIVKPLSSDINDNMITQWAADAANESFDKNKQDIKTKIVKFNTAHDIIEHSNAAAAAANPELPHGASNEIGVIDEKQEKSQESADSLAIPSLPIKQKQMCTPSNTGLAEAINVTLIKSKHEKSKEAQFSVEEGLLTLIHNSNILAIYFHYIFLIIFLFRIENIDKPPEIRPRNEFLKKIAPKPPPIPSKAAELVQRKFDMLKQDRSSSSLSETHLYPASDTSGDAKKIMPKNPAPSDLKVPEISITAPILQHILKNDDVKLLQTPPKPYSKYNAADGAGEESELLTPNRTKTLTLKKKNSILAKRRKICLKTLEFSDIQGHLFRRTKDKHGVTYWAKLYFVLVDAALYGFRNKNSQKANCLIFLSGFTISLAKEVHSKPFAYKVYHPKKTFYFAAESEQALAQWMDYIKRATLKVSPANMDPMLIDSIDNRDIFSETDSSEDETESTNGDTPPPTLFKHSFLGGSKASKKRGSIDDTSSITTQSKSEKYHLGFGSLKKFTTNLHNLPFSSNKSEKEREERKKPQSSDIPVPTAQFRSYRKIPGNAGMQLGSNAMPMDYNNMMTHRMQPNPTQSNVPSISSPVIISDQIPSNEFAPKPNTSILSSTIYHESPGSGIASPGATASVSAQISSSMATTPNALKSAKQSTESTATVPSTSQTKTYEPHFVNKPISKLSKNKTSPFNYMHASNPNLVEFTFQTSKSLDVGLPKVNVSNTFDQHQNLQGFMTLKDLMLQREEDEAHNMYNNRVNLGVEKPSDRQAKRKHCRPNEVSFNENNNRPNDDGETVPLHGQNTAVNKIQRRSLPKTPDYAQSFKTDDTEIIMARSKEGQKLRDFGYEFISGDDMNNANSKSNVNNNGHGAHNSNIGASMMCSNLSKPALLAKPNDRFMLPTKRKGLNWIGLNLDSKRSDDDKVAGKGSFKLTKQKHSEAPDVNRLRIDSANDVFHATAASNRNDNSINFPFTNGDRKGSTPNSTSYLSKLTFSTTKTAKEKRLLGSPRLHRAASSIFGRRNVENPIDHAILPPMDSLPNKYTSTGEHAASLSNNCFTSNPIMLPQSINEPNAGASRNDSFHEMGASNVATNFVPLTSTSLPNSAHQSIEYPPVFVPETYSLRDPNITH